MTLFESRVMCLAWFNGDYLAVGLGNGKIIISNWKTGELNRKFTGHMGAIFSLSFINNAYLISASADSTIKIWDLNQNLALQTISSQEDEVSSLAILNNEHFAIGSSNGVIKIFSNYRKKVYYRYKWLQCF